MRLFGADLARPRPLRRVASAWAQAAIVCVAALAGCTTFDEQQSKWIFQPGDRTWWAGAQAAEGMTDVWIDYTSAADRVPVRLHGLWLDHAGDRPGHDAPVLLYLHGARWDVRSSASRMRRLHALGFSVLGIDYRGFGRSSPGLPSEDRADEDARAAWRWLAERQPGARRYLFGHSLGSAVAVRLASEAKDAAGVIVEGSFTSIPDLVATMKWGWLPVGGFITQRFDAASRVGEVGAPLLVVHGSRDDLIEPALGRALYERAREPKRFLLVEGGTHHDTSAVGLADYRRAVADLFGVGVGAQ
jgi:alpha-beta hydrolase superfamily lysophospholipase